MNTLYMGALLGLSIAVPPGPNAAVCMSRTLAAGRRVGFRCGLGAASATAIYATLAVAGADRAAGLLDRSTFSLHIAGGLILLALGLRLGRSGRVATSPSTGKAYATTLAVGLANPLTILYFAAAVASGTIPAGAGPLVVLGVFVGSATWWTVLTSATAAIHHHLNDRRLGWANRLTASAIGGCGVISMVTAIAR